MQRTAESISQKDNTNSYILIDESRGWIKILNHFSSIFIKIQVVHQCYGIQIIDIQ